MMLVMCCTRRCWRTKWGHSHTGTPCTTTSTSSKTRLCWTWGAGLGSCPCSPLKQEQSRCMGWVYCRANYHCAVCWSSQGAQDLGEFLCFGTPHIFAQVHTMRPILTSLFLLANTAALFFEPSTSFQLFSVLYRQISHEMKIPGIEFPFDWKAFSLRLVENEACATAAAAVTQTHTNTGLVILKMIDFALVQGGQTSS